MGVSEGWGTVENWKSRVSFSHGYNGERRLRRFLAYLNQNEPMFKGFTPDRLIEYQRDAPNGRQYDVLDALQRWVNSMPNLRVESKGAYYISIKSFFDHNRAALPRDRSFRLRSEVEPVRSQLTADIVKRVILASKPRYQAIWAIMLQGGLDEDCFIRWNETGLESAARHLREKPEGPIKIEISGRKGGKNIETFYTFIGRDACRLLGTHLKQRGGEPGPIFPLNLKSGKQAMAKYWNRILVRLGYIEKKGNDKGNRYGLNIHRMRGVFRSRWRLSGVDVEVGEFFMGHSPDKLGYDKSPWLDPDWYEEKYDEAQPWLNILSEDPLHVPRREVTELRKKLSEYETGKSADILALQKENEKLRLQMESLRDQVAEFFDSLLTPMPKVGQKEPTKIKA